MRFLAAALAVAVAGELPAQVACDTTTIAGHVYTLEEVLATLELGAARVNLAVADSGAKSALDSLALQLRDAKAGHITVGEMAAMIVSGHVRVRDVARWDPRASELLAQKWFYDAVLALPLIANGSLLPEMRKQRLSRPTMDSLLAPTNQLGVRVRACASAKSAEKLRHLEVKYGEGSPSLNLAEVGLNYVGQWLPLLKPAADGWPSRYELIAAYRPMELTGTKTSGADARATLISAGQLGIRWYHWDPNWGSGGRIAQLERPRYASLGAYAIGPQDKPLQKPWENGRRLGVFLGWGDVHAAYVFDAPRRVLIGHGKQLIPYVF